LLLILDSNEYLFAFGFAKKPASAALLDLIIRRPDLHKIRVPRMVIGEIRRNLPGDVFREVLIFIQLLGLKAADALIAAYAEWVGAELLVSENRHFLTRRSDLPFKVLTAEQALKLL